MRFVHSADRPVPPPLGSPFEVADLVRGMRWVWALGGLTLRELARRVWRGLVHEDALGRTAELSYYFLLALMVLSAP
jgi:hypothetical protein